MIQNILIGFVPGAVIAVIMWIRFYRKDRATSTRIEADAKKVSAEADAIIIENFRGILKTYQEENKILHLTVAELKQQVMKLQEQVAKLNKQNNGQGLDNLQSHRG